MSADPSTVQEILASANVLIPAQRLQDSLAEPASLPLLHRSQWLCLARSYPLVLQTLSGMLDLARSSSLDRPSGQDKSMWCTLSQPLHALHLAMTEAETCMQESLPCSYNSTHSWLAEKALPQSMSTEVVDVHLHQLMFTFSAVCEQILGAVPPSIHGEVFSCTLQLTRDLSTLWASCSADDFRGARSLLSQLIKRQEEEREACQLADFLLQKLSCVESNLTRITHDAALPPFLWIDPEALQRNPNTLGEGGYGRVHEAVWLGGRFAVKDFFYVEKEAFGREACIQAQLRHPNVLPLVCCTRIPSLNKCSLVMELMQQDLRVLMMQRMEAGMNPPFSLAVALDLMLQIARGMEYLHSESLRIIHRDLKSSNILVQGLDHGRSFENDVSSLRVHLKVADFGMSKAKYASSSRYTTRPVGTTPWRAPEVFKANSEDESGLQDEYGRYTNKADVYSFALVCYEILTGKPPFEGTQIQRRVLAGERPRLPLSCPPALASYIQTCWHAEPARRPAFPQICRMLRYFKACILLREHAELQHNQNSSSTVNVDWLLQPVSPAVCDCIDDMRQSVVQQFDCNLQIHPVVLIPLEMYCCRKILQNRDYTVAANADQFAVTSSEEISSSNPSLITALEDTAGVASQIQLEEIWMGLNVQRNGVEQMAQSRRPSKVYRARTLGWLKRLAACWQGKLDNNSDQFPDSVILAAKGFTYAELAEATNNFSDSSLIGRAGAGNVYLGTLEDGRRIAVKQEMEGVHGHQYANAMLVQELTIACQLRHRNVVPVLGWCVQARGRLLLVYEYMPNGDLGKHIFGMQGRIGVLEWKLRYKIVSQVAAALKYLHQDSGYKQIVHRDVKPGNILLDSEWNARLGDCGLALLLEAGQYSSREMVAGTMGYLAPEYAIDGSLSPAADIYSFGVTILEIVTGRSVHKRNLGIDREKDLVSWVRELYGGGDVMQAVDTRLEGRYEEVEMERLLLLALACTNAIPETRPDIEQVLRILSGLSWPPPPGSSGFNESYVAPNMQPGARGSSSSNLTTSTWSSSFLTMQC